MTDFLIALGCLLLCIIAFTIQRYYMSRRIQNLLDTARLKGQASPEYRRLVALMTDRVPRERHGEVIAALDIAMEKPLTETEKEKMYLR